MTKEQSEVYYGMLAYQTGSAVISRVLDGNESDAKEIAISAAKFAFAGYPELREVL